MRATFAAGLPLIAAQLVQVSNGFVDALVAGRLGDAELAAGGIGAAIWFFAALLPIGLMAGLSPMLSEMIGQGRRAAVGQRWRQGLWFGLVTGLVSLCLILVLAATMHLWPLKAELVPLIRQYLWTACWSLYSGGSGVRSRLVWLSAPGINRHRYRDIRRDVQHGYRAVIVSAHSAL